MPTIYDVARRAGCSTYTVSAVINRSAYVSPDLTRRVQDAVRELDYTINELARGLQTRRTKTIGMLIPDIGGHFYAKVVKGAEEVLKHAGYSLLLGSSYNDPKEQNRYLTLFRAKQTDGLLLFVAPGDQGELNTMVDNRKPVVFVGRAPRGFEADSVCADNLKGTLLVMDELIARGHRRIGIITGHRDLTPSVDRVAAWRKALRKVGIKPEKSWLGEGDWTAESGYRIGKVMLETEPIPTAIYAGNFPMMTGLLRAIRETGKSCPADVDVMSSDDSAWLDYFEPRISTVVQPSYEMGVKAAELLLKRIKSPNRRYENVVLKPELRLRPHSERMGSAASS